jgi:hypothetical protein
VNHETDQKAATVTHYYLAVQDDAHQPGHPFVTDVGDVRLRTKTLTAGAVRWRR